MKGVLGVVSRSQGQKTPLLWFRSPISAFRAPTRSHQTYEHTKAHARRNEPKVIESSSSPSACEGWRGQHGHATRQEHLTKRGGGVLGSGTSVGERQGVSGVCSGHRGAGAREGDGAKPGAWVVGPASRPGAAPNQGLQATAHSLRSCLAAAMGGA